MTIQQLAAMSTPSLHQGPSFQEQSLTSNRAGDFQPLPGVGGNIASPLLLAAHAVPVSRTYVLYHQHGARTG